MALNKANKTLLTFTRTVVHDGLLYEYHAVSGGYALMLLVRG